LSGRRLLDTIMPEGCDIHHTARVFHTGTPASIRVTSYPVTHQLHDSTPLFTKMLSRSLLVFPLQDIAPEGCFAFSG
jgi:hypothetical protein